MVKLKIPAPLRTFTRGRGDVLVSASNVKTCLVEIEKEFPGLLEQICDDNNQLRPFINIYVNGESIQFLNEMETVLHDGDEVSIVPAIAGG